MNERIQRLQKYAAKVGLTIQSVDTAELEGTGGARTAFVAVAGGSLRPDTVAVLGCADPSGKVMTLYQPYLKGIQLPGEFHATIDGAVSRPLEVRGATYLQREQGLRIVLSAICVATLILAPVAIYLLFFHGRASFVGSDGKTVTIGAETTRATRALKRFARVGGGKVFPKWLVQLSPAGNGQSHVVMSAADYGGLLANDPGFGAFQNLCRALSKELPGGNHEAAPPLSPPRY